MARVAWSDYEREILHELYDTCLYDSWETISIRLFEITGIKRSAYACRFRYYDDGPYAFCDKVNKSPRIVQFRAELRDDKIVLVKV
jgi:hypothetical protein